MVELRIWQTNQSLSGRNIHSYVVFFNFLQMYSTVCYYPMVYSESWTFKLDWPILSLITVVLQNVSEVLLPVLSFHLNTLRLPSSISELSQIWHRGQEQDSHCDAEAAWGDLCPFHELHWICWLSHWQQIRNMNSGPISSRQIAPTGEIALLIHYWE